MTYRLLALDIDGTLRAAGEPRVLRRTAEAVRAVQKQGVLVAVATGRGRGGIPAGMLRGIRPDYWICASGAQVLDKNGAPLYTSRMTAEEMYALVDYCENWEQPLGFAFTDGSYVYLEYEALHRSELAAGVDESLQDGEDQDHHLQEMPLAAFGALAQEHSAAFSRRYPYFGLRFLYYRDGFCDILRPDQDKAVGLQKLLDALELTPAEAVAVGDGDNDCGMLRLAGLGDCVASGNADARAASDRLCPSPAEDGVGALCRELWPEAFAVADAPAPAGGAEPAAAARPDGPAACAVPASPAAPAGRRG